MCLLPIAIVYAYTGDLPAAAVCKTVHFGCSAKDQGQECVAIECAEGESEKDIGPGIGDCSSPNEKGLIVVGDCGSDWCWPMLRMPCCW